MSSHSHCVSFTGTLNQTKSRLVTRPAVRPVSRWLTSDLTDQIWRPEHSNRLTLTLRWEMTSHWCPGPLMVTQWSLMGNPTLGRGLDGVAPISWWANGNDTSWSGLEHGQWSPRPSSDTMRDVSHVSGSQASFRPEPYRDTQSGNQE